MQCGLQKHEERGMPHLHRSEGRHLVCSAVQRQVGHHPYLDERPRRQGASALVSPSPMYLTLIAPPGAILYVTFLLNPGVLPPSSLTISI
jgi:hypothetical protein